jgi:hypothetical protein
MNSSLAPNDALGRMLHTFNTTACEIAECNFSNIKSLGLIKPPQSRSSTIRIGQIIPENIVSGLVSYPKITLDGNKISFSAYSVSIVDAEPGTIFKLEFYNHDP